MKHLDDCCTSYQRIYFSPQKVSVISFPQSGACRAGFDPGMANISNFQIEDRLDPSDAYFVDVIDTDSLSEKRLQDFGHANFYIGRPKPSQCHVPRILRQPQNFFRKGIIIQTYILSPARTSSMQSDNSINSDDNSRHLRKSSPAWTQMPNIECCRWKSIFNIDFVGAWI